MIIPLGVIPFRYHIHMAVQNEWGSLTVSRQFCEELRAVRTWFADDGTLETPLIHYFLKIRSYRCLIAGRIDGGYSNEILYHGNKAGCVDQRVQSFSHAEASLLQKAEKVKGWVDKQRSEIIFGVTGE